MIRSQMPQGPFVSVIIPVWNDAYRLQLCLQALEKQTYPRTNYEIIVVDNDSTDEIYAVKERFRKVIWEKELQLGSYAARNKGLSVAKGAIIAFTDSDCIPDQDWIEAGVKRLISIADCDLIGGEIKLFCANENHPKAIELYCCVQRMLNQERRVQEHNSATANLFTHKKVFSRVGIFDASLLSGGDVEWGLRTFKMGYKLIYANDVCVRHPALASWSELRRRTIRITGGQFDIAKKREYTFATYMGEILNCAKSIIVPPIRTLYRFNWHQAKLTSNKNKLKFILIFFLIHYVRNFEMLRLRLGGRSKR